MRGCSGVPALLFDELSGPGAPSSFGGYDVVHQLGSGTLGPVFRAVDPPTGRPVAVKVFRLDLLPEDAARLAAALDALVEAHPPHPVLAQPLAAGLEGSTPFLVSEFVSGRTLDVAFRPRTRVEPGACLPWLGAVAEAVDAAWGTRLGHGLLHPRDVFVQPGRRAAWLTGAGIGWALSGLGLKLPVRRPYTSPERVAGQPWDVRADVFALAAIAHEWLTGRRPVGVGEQDGTFIGVEPDASRALRRVLAVALSERPEDRFVSAAAFVEALVDAARGGQMTLPMLDAAPTAGDGEREGGPDATVWVVDRTEIDHAHEDERRLDAASEETHPVDPPPAMPLEDLSLGRDPETGASDSLPGDVTGPAAAWPVPVVDASPGRGRWAVMAAVGLIGLAVGVAGLRLLVPRPASSEAAGETEVVLSGGGTGASAARSEGRAPGPGAAPGDTDVAVTGDEVAPEAPALQPAAGATAPPVRRAAVQTGRLVVTSQPSGALLLVDGRLRGETPATIGDLTLGPHTLQVARPGFTPVTREVTLSPGDPSRTVSVTLEAGVDPRSALSGRLVVESRPPGARVLVDGRPAGLTPLRLDRIGVGRHAVRIELAGYRPVSTTVVVEGGQPARVAVTLEPAAGRPRRR